MLLRELNIKNIKASNMTTQTKTTWRKVKFGEIMKISRDFGRKIKVSEYKAKGLIKIYDQGSDYISGYTDDLKAVYKGKLPAILFGDHTLRLRLINDKFAIGADGIQILEPLDSIVDRIFFYYLLKYAIKNLKSYGYERHLKYLREIEISYPEDIKKQKRIADILSAFDDKIEVNNKIIKTLETMAQEIFKEFFEKNSKFEEDNIKNAEEIFVFERGIEPGSKFYSEIKKEGYIAFYRVRDLDNQNRVDVYIPKEIANGKICRETDVLISLDATLGRVKIGCSGAYSSGIRKVYSKDGFIKNSFIYFWLKSHYVQNTILKHASGSTILHAGQSLKFLTFPFNKNLIEKIQFIIDPMFIKILKILKENQTLAAIRDLLLPKLMRGEIRI
jgi:restriction endonuclease S subunit